MEMEKYAQVLNNEQIIEVWSIRKGAMCFTWEFCAEDSGKGMRRGEIRLYRALPN